MAGEELAPIEQLIVTIRGQRVILAGDLVRIYGVQTRVLNQAVKRNPAKFPVDFVFQLQRMMDILDPPPLPRPRRRAIGFRVEEAGLR